jgi:hypothetical protein
MFRDDLMSDESEALVFACPTPSLPIFREAPPKGAENGEGDRRSGGAKGGWVGALRFAFVFCFAMMFLDETNYSNKPCSIALAIALVRLDTLSFS